MFGLHQVVSFRQFDVWVAGSKVLVTFGSEGMVGHLREFPTWPISDRENNRSLLKRRPIFDLTAVRVRRTVAEVHSLMKSVGLRYLCGLFEL